MKQTLMYLIIVVAIVTINGCKKCVTCQWPQAIFTCHNGTDTIIKYANGRHMTLFTDLPSWYTCDTTAFFFKPYLDGRSICGKYEIAAAESEAYCEEE